MKWYNAKPKARTLYQVKKIKKTLGSSLSSLSSGLQWTTLLGSTLAKVGKTINSISQLVNQLSLFHFKPKEYTQLGMVAIDHRGILVSNKMDR